MQRILTATVFLLTLGLAFGQPPVDYTLLCEVEVEGEVQTTVVGAASSVDGELHVALDEDYTPCEGTLSVEQDETLTVDIGLDEETGETTVSLETEGDDPVLSAIAQTLPEEAIAGMVGAQKNRAMAAEHRAEAQDKAEAARERGKGAPEEADEEGEEPLPEDLPETPDDEIEGPDAAIEHATEVSGGVGPDAKPEAPGAGRP